MRKSRFSTLAVVTSLLVISATSFGQSWKKLAATGGPATAGCPLLLQDGSVFVHNIDTPDWYRLIPDNKGSYANGTWKKAGSLPSDYGPRFFASAVLTDGRVVIFGGEYNFFAGVWTNLGAIYDPATNLWKHINGPPGWGNIGDAQCTLLADGRFMLANPFDTRTAILDSKTLTWTNTGSGKADRNDEEGWTLMPDGTILIVDAENAPGSERYLPSLGAWISAGTIPVNLTDAGSQEIGPAALMPNGKVFAMGGTTHTALYTPGAALTDPGTWVAGPDFPSLGSTVLQMADAPCCVLPNGHVLLSASPGVFANPAKFFEFDGTKFIPVAEPPNAASTSCWTGNMLMLPTGQVLFTDQTSDVEIYTPTGGPQDAWLPKITAVPSVIFVGQTVTVTGQQLNGLTQCNYYGDDTTNATNYPLCRITNKATGHVFFCKTSNHTSMGVATGTKSVSTFVTVPKTIETGASTLVIVANGIQSKGVPVTITLQTIAPESVATVEASSSIGALADIVDVDSRYFSIGSANIKAVGQVASLAVTFPIPGGTTFNSLQFSFTGHVDVSKASAISAFCFVWDYVANNWHYVAVTPLTSVDKGFSFQVDNASRYISSTGKSKVYIRAINPSGTHSTPSSFFFRLDKVGVAPG